MLKKILPVVLLPILFGCQPKQAHTPNTPDTFSLQGETKGFDDSTWFFLTYADHVLDSVQVMQGKFQFTGHYPDSVPAAQMILHTQGFRDYKFFWAEPKALHCTGEKGHFRNAKIAGSATQQVSDEYDQFLAPAEEAADSAMQRLAKARGTKGNTMELELKVKEAQAHVQERSITFLREHPGSIVSANTLSIMCSTYGRIVTQELYDHFSEANKRSAFGKDIHHYLTLNRDVKVGDHFVDFEQPTPNGERLKLSSVPGKVILLEFWASWCVPCRDENPNLVKTYRAFHKKGFEVLGVSLDSKREHWVDAIQKDGLGWPQVSDLKGGFHNDAALIYGVSAIPDNLLIDSQGIVIAKSLRGEALRKRLGELLK